MFYEFEVSGSIYIEYITVAADSIENAEKILHEKQENNELDKYATFYHNRSFNKKSLGYRKRYALYWQKRLNAYAENRLLGSIPKNVITVLDFVNYVKNLGYGVVCKYEENYYYQVFPTRDVNFKEG